MDFSLSTPPLAITSLPNPVTHQPRKKWTRRQARLVESSSSIPNPAPPASHTKDGISWDRELICSSFSQSESDAILQIKNLNRHLPDKPTWELRLLVAVIKSQMASSLPLILMDCGQK
ncbi:RING/U-box protein with C6HC-type zinc finger [Striga asiatica]|uniref:RING/U-box protein with C6HC-type zinc finger n=1 Tax=Striga asiatica TaxID=4170 RepID=A0A5A7R2C7_STRAF|nr:RING/U-box protein with C6HC-type zinc finger [Striga asiatica]